VRKQEGPVLFFIALLFTQLLPSGIWPLALLIDLVCIVFLGSIIIQMRSGPPW
jgi:hypothetical protein